jgi:hypothetical protein
MTRSSNLISTSSTTLDRAVHDLVVILDVVCDLLLQTEVPPINHASALDDITIAVIFYNFFDFSLSVEVLGGA